MEVSACFIRILPLWHSYLQSHEHDNFWVHIWIYTFILHKARLKIHKKIFKMKWRGQKLNGKAKNRVDQWTLLQWWWYRKIQKPYSEEGTNWLLSLAQEKAIEWQRITADTGHEPEPSRGGAGSGPAHPRLSHTALGRSLLSLIFFLLGFPRFCHTGVWWESWENGIFLLCDMTQQNSF